MIIIENLFKLKFDREDGGDAQNPPTKEKRDEIKENKDLD